MNDDRLDISEREAIANELKIVSSLDENIKNLKLLVGPSPDFVIRRLKVGRARLDASLIYLSEMIDTVKVQELIEFLSRGMLETNLGNASRQELIQVFREMMLPPVAIGEARLLDDLWDYLVLGYTAVLFDGWPGALIYDTVGLEKRSIEEPSAETVIRGPRDGFIDALGTNISLLRRKIKTPNLWFESFTVGDLTRTRVVIAYIKGLASEELVAEVRQRISRIKTDHVLESGYIEEFISDQPYSVFPTVFRSERPDRIASGLVDGRVAILTDGTPFVLLVPMELSMMLSAPDDYYEKVPIGSFLRFLRFFAFFISVALPGIYVGVINFHQELLPTQLLLKIASTREGVPFPVVFEVFMMEMVFEMLREAGIRLPRAVGPAISIVGALVLGDAAVRAGIVSPAVVIVVALTAIASFTIPTFSFGIAARLYRFILIILGAIMGLFGVQFGLLVLTVYSLSVRSFGYPFFAPLAPFISRDQKDLYVRSLWPSMKRRPKLLGLREPVRTPPGQIPRQPIEPEPQEKSPRKRYKRYKKWNRSTPKR